MIKKIKSFVKKYGVFRIRNNTLFKLNKSYKVFLHLKKKYGHILNKNYPYAYEVPANKVWFCWLQGLENAPELVKSCYDYLIKNLKDKEIIVVTEDNFRNYTNIPEFIIEKWKKGIISNTHFSDILRLELLAKNGGAWVDSTVLFTADIPNYINKSDFFVFSCEYRNDEAISLSSWFIYSSKNHPVTLATRDMIYEYWKNNNKLIHYFLLHMFMTMAMEKFSNLIENMPFVSNINPHVMQFKYLFKPYDEETANFIKSTCFAHKLSYKFDKELINLSETHYRAIIERKF